MKFNLNESVKVRLNDHGKAILRKQHEQTFKGMEKDFPYQAPKEDGDGYSQWQLWVLMKTFGPHLGNGCRAPFDLDIEL